MNVRAVLMVGMVEQNFVEASPIKYFSAFGALRKMLFFFRRHLFAFVEFHRSRLTHSLRFLSLNAIVRSSLQSHPKHESTGPGRTLGFPHNRCRRKTLRLSKHPAASLLLDEMLGSNGCVGLNGAERWPLEAVLIHKTPAGLSPRLIPSSPQPLTFSSNSTRGSFCLLDLSLIRETGNQGQRLGKEPGEPS